MHFKRFTCAAFPDLENLASEGEIEFSAVRRAENCHETQPRVKLYYLNAE